MNDKHYHVFWRREDGMVYLSCRSTHIFTHSHILDRLIVYSIYMPLIQYEVYLQLCIRKSCTLFAFYMCFYILSFSLCFPRSMFIFCFRKRLTTEKSFSEIISCGEFLRETLFWASLMNILNPDRVIPYSDPKHGFSGFF